MRVTVNTVLGLGEGLMSCGYCAMSSRNVDPWLIFYDFGTGNVVINAKNAEIAHSCFRTLVWYCPRCAWEQPISDIRLPRMSSRKLISAWQPECTCGGVLTQIERSSTRSF